MSPASALQLDSALTKVLDAFPFPAPPVHIAPYGNGHINRTYCVVCKDANQAPVRYILQGLSQTAFAHPEQVMENFIGITSFLKKKIEKENGDPTRQTLSVIPTRDGKKYYTDIQGQLWRLMPFIENTECYQSATPALFEASARAFGNFQYLLADYPAETLYETIPNFHNTEDRLAKFLHSLQKDPMGRAAEVQKEIQFVMDRQADCSVLVDAQREGKLPLRVTHNDTKLNNILMDADTHEGICIVDLDTTMPGLSAYDFGDAIRFGANNGAEDEKNPNSICFDLRLFAAYTRGFLEGTKGTLTPAELEYLPWGARIITLECGIRFLTDYLDGDVYFHAKYPGQNLDRARTQFKLVQDMEAQFSQMCAVIAQYTA